MRKLALLYVPQYFSLPGLEEHYCCAYFRKLKYFRLSYCSSGTFFIPLLSFQEAKLVNFCLSLYSVATLAVIITAQRQIGSTLCCAVPHTFEMGNVLSEGPGAVLGK